MPYRGFTLSEKHSEKGERFEPSLINIQGRNKGWLGFPGQKTLARQEARK